MIHDSWCKTDWFNIHEPKIRLEAHILQQRFYSTTDCSVKTFLAKKDHIVFKLTQKRKRRWRKRQVFLGFTFSRGGRIFSNKRLKAKHMLELYTCVHVVSFWNQEHSKGFPACSVSRYWIKTQKPQLWFSILSLLSFQNSTYRGLGYSNGRSENLRHKEAKWSLQVWGVDSPSKGWIQDEGKPTTCTRPLATWWWRRRLWKARWRIPVKA